MALRLGPLPTYGTPVDDDDEFDRLVGLDFFKSRIDGIESEESKSLRFTLGQLGLFTSETLGSMYNDLRMRPPQRTKPNLLSELEHSWQKIRKKTLTEMSDDLGIEYKDNYVKERLVRNIMNRLSGKPLEGPPPRTYEIKEPVERHRPSENTMASTHMPGDRRSMLSDSAGLACPVLERPPPRTYQMKEPVERHRPSEKTIASTHMPGENEIDHLLQPDRRSVLVDSAGLYQMKEPVERHRPPEKTMDELMASTHMPGDRRASFLACQVQQMKNEIKALRMENREKERMAHEIARLHEKMAKKDREFEHSRTREEEWKEEEITRLKKNERMKDEEIARLKEWREEKITRLTKNERTKDEEITRLTRESRDLRNDLAMCEDKNKELEQQIVHLRNELEAQLRHANEKGAAVSRGHRMDTAWKNARVHSENIRQIQSRSDVLDDTNMLGVMAVLLDKKHHKDLTKLALSSQRTTNALSREWYKRGMMGDQIKQAVRCEIQKCELAIKFGTTDAETPLTEQQLDKLDTLREVERAVDEAISHAEQTQVEMLGLISRTLALHVDAGAQMDHGLPNFDPSAAIMERPLVVAHDPVVLGSASCSSAPPKPSPSDIKEELVVAHNPVVLGPPKPSPSDIKAISSILMQERSTRTPISNMSVEEQLDDAIAFMNTLPDTLTRPAAPRG